MPASRRRQAQAIRRLPGCGRPDAAASLRDWCSSGSCDSRSGAQWAPVTLPACRRRPSSSSASDGLTGQAVVVLPLCRADVALHLPPALQLAATASGGLDCRLQLLSLSADWPPSRPASSSSSSCSGSSQPPQPRVLAARSAVAGFGQRCGGLLLAHMLFPEHTKGMLGWLSVPVAVADGVAAVGSAVPPEAWQAAGARARRLKDRMQGRRQRSGSGSSSGSAGPAPGLGWLDGTCGVASGTLHGLRCLSGAQRLVCCIAPVHACMHALHAVPRCIPCCRHRGCVGWLTPRPHHLRAVLCPQALPQRWRPSAGCGDCCTRTPTCWPAAAWR